MSKASDNEITARILQQRCNQRGSNLKVDGWAGTRTRAELDIHLPALVDDRPSVLPPTPRPPTSGKYVEQVHLTDNRRRSPKNTCEGAVLHHCGGWAKDGNIRAGSAAWILNPASNVSYHCLIAWDGTRTIFVPDDEQAWHAGRSVWNGRSNCNAFTLGVAFGGDTVSGAHRPNDSPELTEPEIESFLEWYRPRALKYGWTQRNVTTHRHISPGRKNDVSAPAEAQIRTAIDNM